MLPILLFLILLVTPGIFWFYGPRFLGSQTHPAAVFILTWIASFVLLGFAAPKLAPLGATALVWVVLNFAVCAGITKVRSKLKSKQMDEKDADSS